MTNKPEHPNANAPVSRRRLLQLGGGLIGGAIAGATFGAVASGAARAAAAKPASLNMLYATSEANSDAIKALLPDFKAATGIDINLDTMPYNALQQKTFAELASGSSYYDIMIVDTPWMPALTNKIEPITGMVLDTGLSADLDIKDFIPKVFYDTTVFKRDASYLHFDKPDVIDPQAIKAAGFEIYGLPMQANVLTLAYRKDLFEDPANQKAYKEKTGKDLAPPATWEDFASVAEFFTDPSKRRWGTTLMAGAGDWATDDFKTLLAGFGGDGHLVNDKFEPVFDSPEGVQALKFYSDLINAKKVTPPGTTSASWDNVATSFADGLTAMTMNYHDLSLSPNVKGSVAYAVIPKGVSIGPHFGTWMLSINSFSKNKEWAFRAIQWFTSAQSQKKALAHQLHPTRISVYESAVKDPALSDKFNNFYEVLGKSLAVGVGRPRLTNYGDVDRAIWVAVNDTARGAATPEEALKKAAGQVTDLLKQAGYKVQ
ncbi:MAG: sugar ABC transporter substrate-binding protein [Caulobacteraceae bacterium]|nr:sugar ABC transporter substrate-binding protein [Caulobacteraceae bacterium]